MSDEMNEEFGLEPSTTREIFQVHIQAALDTLVLAEQDVEIIKFRFGIPGKNIQSRNVVSNKYEVTVEYIKQLELKVFREFKHLLNLYCGR